MNGITFMLLSISFVCTRLLSMELPPLSPKLSPSKQVPNAVAQTYLDRLSQDLQGEILSYVKRGNGILNIPAFAQATMAMGDIKDPEKLLGILQSMPTKAASLNLAKKLQNASAMNNSIVQEWIESITPGLGRELYGAIKTNPDFKTVASLLEKPFINLEVGNNFGTTPLMMAVDVGRVDIARLLIEAGADVNAKDFVECTALIMACYDGKIEIARLLLAAGSDYSYESDKVKSAIDCARQQGHSKIVQLLVEVTANQKTKPEKN